MVRLKDRRLHSKTMFDYVFNRGRRVSCGFLSIIAAPLPHKAEISRVGFIIRKSTGKAVQRNRIRRILRRAFQQFLIQDPGVWLVFNIPPGPIKSPQKAIYNSVSMLLKTI